MRWIPALLVSVPAVGVAVFGLPVTTLQILVLAVAVAPWRRTSVRLAAVGLWCMASLTTWWRPLHEYADRVDVLAAKVAEGGPGALSTLDCLGIWTLNVGMAAGGTLAGFPEVALETLLLAVPHGGEVVLPSGFAMRSPEVAAQVDRWAQGEAGELGPRTVPLFYDYGHHGSMRVALALSCPLVLSGRAIPSGDRMQLDLRATCHVAYPAGAKLHLGRARGRPILVDETLFAALQERGWLHPYTITWTWTIWR